MIALKTIYAQCLKPSHLCWGFDAFGDGKYVKLLSDGNQCLCDLLIVRVLGNVSDELSIYF